jgi:hypothetical protein
MAPRFAAQMFCFLTVAAAGFGQTLPQPTVTATVTATTATARVYLLLKPGVADPGPAHDAFTQRVAALGAINLQFVSGTNAAKCEVPPALQAALGSDPDVTAVLPIDQGLAPSPAPPPPSAPIVSPMPPLPGPVFSTPPYIPPQQPMSISPSMPVGGGMSAGMAMLTDFAGNMVVKLLNPGLSCKIRLSRTVPAISPSGGSGAFEVKASGNCAWQAVSTADWLHVKTEANTGGTVAVIYSATPNSTGHRQAVVVLQPVAGMAALKGHTVMLVGQQ